MRDDPSAFTRGTLDLHITTERPHAFLHGEQADAQVSMTTFCSALVTCSLSSVIAVFIWILLLFLSFTCGTTINCVKHKREAGFCNAPGDVLLVGL